MNPTAPPARLPKLVSAAPIGADFWEWFVDPARLTRIFPLQLERNTGFGPERTARKPGSLSQKRRSALTQQSGQKSPPVSA